MRLTFGRLCNWDDEGKRSALDTLRRIERKLDWLILEGKIMAINFDKLTAEVARNTSVDDSAVLAIQGLTASVNDLKQQVADLIASGADPAAIQAAIDAYAASLTASTDKLAAAIPANT